MWRLWNEVLKMRWLWHGCRYEKAGTVVGMDKPTTSGIGGCSHGSSEADHMSTLQWKRKDGEVMRDWAFIQGASFWLPLILVGLVAFTLFAINQFNTAFETVRSDDEWIATFTRWLHINRGWQLLETKRSPEGFMMRVQIAENRRIVIVRSEGTLSVGGSIVPSPEHKNALDEASELRRRRLYADVAVQLAQIGVEPQVEADGYHITRVRYARAVPLDRDLTEFRLGEAIGAIQRSQVMVANMIALAAMEAEVEKQTASLAPT